MRRSSLPRERPIPPHENERGGPEKGKPPATAGRKAPGLLEVGREVAELPKDPSPLGSVPHGTLSRGFDMARSMSGRRLGGLLAFLMSGLLFLGAVSASAVGDEELGPRRHMLALTNTDRVYHDRATLSFAERLAAYAKSHSEAMADKGYIYHSTGDQLREALEGYHWGVRRGGAG